jgi:hypothetical protein
MNAREQVNVWAAQVADAVERDDISVGVHELTEKIWGLSESQARSMLSGLVIDQGLVQWRAKQFEKLADMSADEVVASWL